ncbi:hypothetical protein [Deinococcus soli (ex Cha et al. 2016)]|uniref:hypothetical protein n=1 Tax=Deinococcus soli (ex Cha et al. 2016) TaxID=1309411 RepID=UPI00166F49D3|nr:hypothetical protein [Deinococcus soli (ex Cha et al. 2016)]GGB69086.1 hypothetical protein GCM10008019_26630 [Deinococcus soli (ex Cha et al. 2016)]
MSEDKPPVMTHHNIGQLERGGIGYTIDTALAEAMADCRSRPSLTAKRTVVLKLTFSPQDNSLDEGRPGLSAVDVQAEVKVSLPARKGGVETLAVRSGVGASGKVETQAVFIQPPLFPGSN